MQLFSSLLQRMSGRPHARRTPAPNPTQRFRPRLEALEARWLLSPVLVVSNTLDSGKDSLRYEVAMADKTGAHDTIEFNIPTTDPGYNPSTGAWTITLTGGELDITGNLTIQGPGAGQLTISGGGNSRVFDEAQNATATLSGLTISGGVGVTGAPLGGDYRWIGDGILNFGTLTISGCTLSGNSVPEEIGPSGAGGGIANFGMLTVSSSTLSGNSAVRGGGIYNAGTLTVDCKSTLSGNGVYGQGGFGFGYGGGIYNAGTATLQDSILSGNGVGYAVGGGIYNAGTLTVSGCTISGNGAGSGFGAGIDNTGTLALSTTTLSGNRAEFVGNTVYGYGGGIYNSGTLTVSGCTFSSNITDSAGGGIYNAGTAAALTVSGSTFSGNYPDNISGPYTDGGGNTFS
jgi:hypothetical protein